MLVKLTERIKDGYFASPAILQVSNFSKRRPTVEVMMILHMNIKNLSKFRSDDSLPRVDMKYFFSCYPQTISFI